MEQEFENEKQLLELNRDLGFENSTIFFGDTNETEEENLEPETETPSVFDVDSENEFSEFVGKKAKERRKVKKELKKTGLSNKEARKQALVEVGRGKIGKGVLKVAFAPMRGAFLSLLLLNFRGIATKIMAIEKGTQADLKKKLVSAWENRLGGDYDELIKAASKAENKKPFFCGKKCKLKVVEKVGSSSFVGFVGKSGSIYDNYNNVAGGDDAVIGVYVGLAGTVLGVIGNVANGAQVNKGKKLEIEAAERMADKELATLTANQKAQIEAAERRLQAEADPKKAILNNPDLTAEEKKASIELFEKTESQSDTRNIRKILMIGVPVTLLVGFGFYFLTRKQVI